MATNLNFIICVTKATTPGHAHITHVGLGTMIEHYRERVPVATVRAAIRNGDRYYTVSPKTGKAALVEAYDCPSCKTGTIRSAPDSTTDNNLDNLSTCE